MEKDSYVDKLRDEILNASNGKMSMQYYSNLFSTCKTGSLETLTALYTFEFDINKANEDEETSLFIACSNGNVEIVKFLISKGADLNKYDKYMRTPIYIASRNGHLNIVKLLVDMGANITIINKDGYSAFNCACFSGHLDIVKYLSKLNEYPEFDIINLPNKGQMTPIYIACSKGHIEIVDFLIQVGANVNISDELGKSPLFISCSYGYLDIMKILVMAGANINIITSSGLGLIHIASNNGYLDILTYLVDSLELNIDCKDNDGMTPMHIACHHKRLEIIEYLISKQVNILITNNNGWNIINYAIKLGNLSVIKLIVEKNIKYINAINDCPNNDESNPLINATSDGNYEIVKYLVDKGADVNMCNNTGWSPVNMASLSGRLDILQYLCDNGNANLNTCEKSGGRNPLYMASTIGSLDIVQYICDKRVIDINDCDYDGMTSLNIACNKGHIDVVKYLVGIGASIHISNKFGWLPLNIAIYNGHLKVFEYICDSFGSEIDLNNHKNNSITAIFAASCAGHLNIVKYLLSKGADCNIPNKDGEIPFYAACRYGHVEVAKELISVTIDINYPTKFGWTPLIGASFFGNTDVVKYLVSIDNVEVDASNEDGETSFMMACGHGHIDIAKYLLEFGNANINNYNKDDVSAVYVAASRGFLEVVKYLLQKSANLNKLDKEGRSLLVATCSYGHFDVVKYLIESTSLDLHLYDRIGMTALNCASYSGFFNIVDLLISKDKSDINIPNNDGMTPIFSACSNGHLDVVKLLFENGADPYISSNEGGYNCALIALKNNKEAILDYFLSVNVSFQLPVLLRYNENLNKSPLLEKIMKREKSVLAIVINLHFNLFFKSQFEETYNYNSDVFINDINENNLLLECIKSDNIDILLWIIEFGSNIITNITTEAGETMSILDFSNLNEETKIRIKYILDDKHLYPIQSFIRHYSKCDDKIINIINDNKDSLAKLDYFNLTPFEVAHLEKCSQVVLIEILSQLCKLFVQDKYMFSYEVMISDLYMIKNRTKYKFPSFRLDLPISKNKVYFESVISYSKVFQIGVVNSSWCPKNEGIGVGDDEHGIGIDGPRKCIWRNKMIRIPKMPLCDENNCIIGIGIDMKNSELSFWLDGVKIELDEEFRNISSIMSSDEEVCIAFTLNELNQSCCKLNIGQSHNSDYYMSIPDGFVSVYDYCNGSIPNTLQYYDNMSLSWVNVNKNKGQFEKNYKYDFLNVVSNDIFGNLIDEILSRNALSVVLLSELCDESGRTAYDIASKTSKMSFIKYIYFLGRYEFHVDRFEHKSSTSAIYLAIDHDNYNSPVAIKFMKLYNNYKTEISLRDDSQLSEKFIVSILEKLDCDKSFYFKEELLNKGLSDYNYAIIMPALDKNLQRIIDQDQIAGVDFMQIKLIYKQIINCVEHLHENSVIHGDLKPLNIMRTKNNNIIIIDMDASSKVGEKIGAKYSSSYSPPEFIYIDDSGVPVVKSDLSSDKVLLAHPSFDAWSLGVILFYLCTGEPLFLCNNEQNLDTIELRKLYDWDDITRREKILKIKDLKAANLVFRLLNKNPEKRPTINQILIHPFLSGNHNCTRLIGESAEFDVFLSYRVKSDSNYVEKLYNILTNKYKLKVWWDKICLEPGVPWEIGFCNGLVNSNNFVCLVSKGCFSNINQLNENSYCDNVILEYRLALELREFELITKIFPIFIGEKKDDHNLLNFDWSCVSNWPDIVIKQNENKLIEHLENQSLGRPSVNNMNINTIISKIKENQGGILKEGLIDKSFENVAETIYKMCITNTTTNNNNININSNNIDDLVQKLNETIESLRIENNNYKLEIEKLLAKK